MHAIVKILPVNYILKGNLSKFSIANNLRYTVDKKQVMNHLTIPCSTLCSILVITFLLVSRQVDAI